MAEFSPRVGSTGQGPLMFARNRGESSAVGPFENQLALGGPEVIQEPPQIVETIVVGEMTDGPKVIAEPPQIDPILA